MVPKTWRHESIDTGVMNSTGRKIERGTRLNGKFCVKSTLRVTPHLSRASVPRDPKPTRGSSLSVSDRLV